MRSQPEYPSCPGAEGCAGAGAGGGGGLPGRRCHGTSLHSRNRDAPSHVSADDPLGGRTNFFVVQARRPQPVQETFGSYEHANGGRNSSDVGDGSSVVARNDPARVVCNAVGAGGLGERVANTLGLCGGGCVANNFFITGLFVAIGDWTVGGCTDKSRCTLCAKVCCDIN